jgi:thymidylate kinase
MTLTNHLLSLCFIGIDGSGKTTQANLLLSSLKNHRNYGIYIHSFSRKTIADSFRVRLLINIFIKELNEPSKRKLMRIVKAVLRLGIIFFDSWLTFMIHNAKYGERFVVYDRYHYDNLVLLASRYIDLAKLIMIFSKLLPKPKTIILLKVTPRTAIIRKTEHTYEDAKRICRLYEMLMQILPIFSVDGEQDIQSIKQQIERIVSSKMLFLKEGKTIDR